jgi:hypothetical protein
MNITMLLDHDLEGLMPFLEAGWQETGWDQYLHLEFIQENIRCAPCLGTMVYPTTPPGGAQPRCLGGAGANPICELQRHS